MKIGILDSGVGGLSVLREIRRLLPDIDIHYLGDSAWCPYGSKSPEQIRQRVGQIVDYLLELDVELIVIACNSATIHAVEWLRTVYPQPFVGMEPGVKPACSLTQTGVIGVLATEASIAGEKFLRLVDSTAQGVNVITQPCSKFVELVEAGRLEGEDVAAAIAEYTEPILSRDGDVLVLGCTHYPFLKPAIVSAVPETVQIVDTGEAVARRVQDLLPDESGQGSLVIETTADRDGMERLVEKLVPELLGESGVGRAGIG